MKSKSRLTHVSDAGRTAANLQTVQSEQLTIYQARMAERELHRGESDDFGSVWPGVSSDQSLPNVDRHLTLAFKIAELISDLHSLSVTNPAPSKLNECFANFRRSDDSSRSQHARELKETLEAIALDHPSLTAKSADLPSLIDDCLRSQ